MKWYAKSTNRKREWRKTTTVYIMEGTLVNGKSLYFIWYAILCDDAIDDDNGGQRYGYARRTRHLFIYFSFPFESFKWMSVHCDDMLTADCECVDIKIDTTRQVSSTIHSSFNMCQLMSYMWKTKFYFFLHIRFGSFFLKIFHSARK